jgi:hypothetical protein
MTHETLWTIFTDGNPQFAGKPDETVTMTVRGLKKFFDTTWEQGRLNGFENGQAYEKNQAKMRDSSCGGLFNELFRGTKK